MNICDLPDIPDDELLFIEDFKISQIRMDETVRNYSYCNYQMVDFSKDCERLPNAGPISQRFTVPIIRLSEILPDGCRKTVRIAYSKDVERFLQIPITDIVERSVAAVSRERRVLERINSMTVWDRVLFLFCGKFKV